MTALINALRGRGGVAAPRDGQHEIVVLIRALLLFESSLWAAVTPVLPHYEHVLHVGKPAVGLLTAAYPAGMVPGALIGAWMATRSGVRRPTLIGLLLFSVSVVAFGFGSDILVLDLLRVVQGAACGFVWGGGLTWAVTATTRERRGAVLGSVFGAATLGSLLGPVLGTLAAWAGTEIVFSVVGVIAFGLAIFTAHHAEPPREAPGPRASLRSLPGQPVVRLGFWLILLQAGAIGVMSTLVPLRLNRFGGSSALIGATFIATALVSKAISTPVGRQVDRRGPRPVLGAGLVGGALLTAVLLLPHTPWLLGLACVMALGVPLGVYITPAMSMITAATDRVGVPLAVATLMLNLGWATGEMIGAPVGAGLSQLGGDALPFLGLAGVLLVTLWPVARTRLPRPAAPAPNVQTGSSVTSRATSAA
jgi:predicted MFS family arabinose efflux permease